MFAAFRIGELNIKTKCTQLRASTRDQRVERISRFDMSYAQAPGQNRYAESCNENFINRQLPLATHCARHVDSTNPGRSNFVFRSKPIPEAEMWNRLIGDAFIADILNCNNNASSIIHNSD